MSSALSPESALQLEQLQRVSDELTYGMNAMWLLLTGIGILFMQVGFMALEIGVVRAKVVKAAIYKNLFDHAVGTLAWYVIGYSLFVGDSPLAAGSQVAWFTHDSSQYARIFQQYGFAVTACTIVSGAVISRCRLEVYLVFAFLLSGIVYPIIAHLCWNANGWLAQLGFLDFAGGTVVHLLGGTAAFVGAAACGPRVGRFAELDEFTEARTHRAGSENLGSLVELSEDAGNNAPPAVGTSSRAALVVNLLGKCRARFRPSFRVREAPGHSAVMQGLGALFLYVAWFSFNGGSGGAITSAHLGNLAGRAVVNTMLASACASVIGLVWSKMFHDAYSMDLGVNSLLSGLVAITAPCGYVDPWAAIVIGVLSVPVYILGSNLVLYACKVDDPLNAVAVHAFNGFLGTLWIGLVDLNKGLFYTGNAHLLGVQLLGCVIVIVWTALCTAMYFYGMKWFWPLLPKCGNGSSSISSAGEERPNCLVYSTDVQIVGMDFVHFGGSSFPDFDVEAVAEYNEAKRIKERVIARNNRVSRQVQQQQGGSERKNSETSQHWKDLSVHNKLKSMQSFTLAPSPKNSISEGGGGGGNSRAPSPKHSEESTGFA